ncbi:MAG: transcriptional regulator [Eubacteriales bacterium]|nr:transcriptional regulator [Eubacteriales bacterium]
MSLAEGVKALRNEMGMNRREFCDYFAIPYRTVVDWESGRRHMPEYLLDLMEYKASAEQMRKIREES